MRDDQEEKSLIGQITESIVYLVVLTAIFGPYVYWLGEELMNYLAK